MAIKTARNSILRIAPETKVYLKTNWASDWELVSNLFCNRRRFGVSPAGSDAELEHRYGVGKEYDSQQVVEVPPLLDNGAFVKIEQSGGDEAEIANGVFVGVLQVENNNAYGEVPDENNQSSVNGLERYTAVGLELLLQRKRLAESVVRTAAGDEQQIGRALAFNKFAGGGVIVGGNAAAEAGAKNTLIFCDTLANTSDRRYWTSLDILQYLLAYFAPGTGENEAEIAWSLVGDTAWLAGHTPAIDVQGRTLAEVFDQLVNPQRGAYWRVASDGVTVEVHVHSASDVAIQLDSSQPLLSANADIVDVEADNDPAVETHNETRTNASNYDRVIVRGARIGCLCTLSIADGTLEADWTSSDEAAYKDAAAGAGDYPTSDADKQERNDNFRQTDSLAHVYTRFRIPADWDGLSGDGIGGDKLPAIPVIAEWTAAELEFITQVDTFWVPGLRLQRNLPLQAATDYSGETLLSVGDNYTEIHAEEATLPDGSPADLLTPFAVMQIEDGSPDRYQYVERLAGARDDVNFSCTLRMLDHCPGISIDPEGPAHLIASDDFDADSEEPTAYRPVLDFNTLIATVYLEADRQVEGRFPSDEDFGTGSFVFGGNDIAALSELVIEAGDEYRCEYVAPNTVVGLADGELVSSDGGLIRDDRPRLRTIARMAYQWYQTDRYAVTLVWKSISAFPAIGSYLRTLNGASINAVVTSLEHDFLSSTTTIKTSLAELDVVALVGSNA